MPRSEWDRLYAGIAELDPPARLAQRITALTHDAPPTRRSLVRLGVRAAALAAGALLVAGLLAIAAHTHGGGGGRPAARAPGVAVVANGVSLTLPAGWARRPAASDAPVTDPLTLLVAGTPGVRPHRSACQITSYRIPARGAVVVVVGWHSLADAGGLATPGRVPLGSLTSVRPGVFECYGGPGAAATVRLGGRQYQVNVLVGRHAPAPTVAQALAVGRSFALAAGSVTGLVRIVGGPFPGRPRAEPGASVTIIRTEDHRVVRRLRADRHGRFSVVLRPGRYMAFTRVTGGLPAARQPHAVFTVTGRAGVVASPVITIDAK